tara:strand:- start:8417 stop:8854 length:438 start_codon:yes stop_codon:yes gene_type:complete
MAKFAQGKFTLKNPDKYSGNRTPTYRSSWEWAFMQFCDNHPSIVQWASEAIQIPYKNPLNGRASVYVPDFLVVYQGKNNKKIAELIEVKPKKETTLENAGKSKLTQARAVLNMAKFEAATRWCKQNRIKFRVVTEDDIFHGTKKR